MHFQYPLRTSFPCNNTQILRAEISNSTCSILYGPLSPATARWHIGKQRIRCPCSILYGPLSPATVLCHHIQHVRENLQYPLRTSFPCNIAIGSGEDLKSHLAVSSTDLFPL